VAVQQLYRVSTAGKLTLDLHWGQAKAWQSEKRFIFVLAGTQGGKTSFGPWWLWREIQRHGRGDYLAVTTSYKLYTLKMLPEMRQVYEKVLKIGRYWPSARIIELCDERGKFWAKTSTDPMWGRIILMSAASESGLESATAQAAWLDEVGQSEWSLSQWDAVRRRLSLSQGRALATTTIYNRGYLKGIYDKWKNKHPEYDVISFPSYANPSFPKAEFDAVKREMPSWKVNMFYRGIFDTPAGLIYDVFEPGLNGHVIKPIPIPSEWKRYGGLDFGGVNTAAVLYAEDPDTKILYLIDEYHEGKKTSAEHAKDLKKWKARYWRGGAKSEHQWRREFSAGGIQVRQPSVGEVEVGIDRVYAVHSNNGIYVFDTCEKYLDEKGSYSRVLDENDDPTEEIERKNEYHLMDAERYIISTIRPTTGGWARGANG